MEHKYSVIMDGECKAMGMSLEDAMIFIEALFRKYRKDRNPVISVQRVDGEDSPDIDSVLTRADKIFGTN